jgi:DMSO/TMAO reductase YedYZ heme-binding membrane subunit
MIYFYILYYMKKTKGQSTSQNRQANQRDLVVLRRTIILVAILLIVCLPSVVLYVQYWFSGYLYPAFNHLQHSTYVFSLSILPAISMILTPQLRELVTARWRQNRRIQPVTIVQWNRNNQNIA